jgi:AcrR family transcriptional regulator
MPSQRNGLQSALSSAAGPGQPAGCDGGRRDLPLLGQATHRERADAVRNRRKILAAAEQLFRSAGVAATTMDDIAALAGVGKGTLFRRFGDKSGLAMALLDERERELQQDIFSGSPPLGPGAPPADRLAAFTRAYVAYACSQLDLVIMSETASPGARRRTGVFAFWRHHCTLLLTQAGAPDPQLRADLLLAGLSAEQLQYWLTASSIPADQIGERLARAARMLAVGPAADRSSRV